jgi:hypothetical protein
MVVAVEMFELDLSYIGTRSHRRTKERSSGRMLAGIQTAELAAIHSSCGDGLDCSTEGGSCGASADGDAEIFQAHEPSSQGCSQASSCPKEEDG